MSAAVTSPAAWTLDPAAFPVSGTAREQLAALVPYAILAPSGHNTQPWRFRLLGDVLELRADATRQLRVVDPDDRAMIISCGAAIGAARVAARRFGLELDVRLLPGTEDADRLAWLTVRPGAAASSDDLSRFDALLRRATNRRAYAPTPLPAPLVARVVAAAARHGVTVRPVTDRAEREYVGMLVDEGDRIQASDPAFRAELSAWVHANSDRRGDGMPGAAFGFGELASHIGPLVMRWLDWGKVQGAKDHDLAAHAPALFVFAAPADAPADWLACGMALLDVLLELTSVGVACSFLNQPVEVAALRGSLQAFLALEARPQLVLRAGYAEEVAHTPRRPAAEVLELA
ncbi:MAG: nitroreductase family protein [Gemmatimonadales bacterium]|nr:nitroreductase family protein [Gemmatimonadales bacterium]